jgi:predicted AlkP superfamily pyrophosphatase or phosphodiesterase
MKPRWIVLLLALIVLPLGVQAQSADALPRPPVVISRVLVISLDGTRPDALQIAPASRILALAASGARTWKARTVLPAVTLPAHTSMLTGLDVPDHGVDYNGIPDPECTPVKPLTFLTLAAQAGFQTAMVVGKEKFCIFRQTPDVAYTFARSGDPSVVNGVIKQLDAGATVIFAHFPNPDYFGHLIGWMSDSYIRQLRVTDQNVGRLLDALDTRGLTGQTLIILTADHGGHDHTHGENIPEDRLIPWIIAGPGVVPGLDLGDGISIADTAVTVEWALGLPMPDKALGRPALAAFGLAEPTPGATP